MKRFAVGQRWVTKAAIYGRFFGEVIETSAQGRWGAIVITDNQGNVLDSYIGTAETFQASGDWQLTEQKHDCVLQPPSGGAALAEIVLFRRRIAQAAATDRWPASRTVRAGQVSQPRLASPHR
jgi:hypothetical protein